MSRIGNGHLTLSPAAGGAGWCWAVLPRIAAGPQGPASSLLSSWGFPNKGPTSTNVQSHRRNQLAVEYIGRYIIAPWPHHHGLRSASPSPFDARTRWRPSAEASWNEDVVEDGCEIWKPDKKKCTYVRLTAPNIRGFGLRRRRQLVPEEAGASESELRRGG